MLVAHAIGMAYRHVEVRQKVVRRYFMPSLSGSGPTTSKWMEENLLSGTGKKPDPGLTVGDCLATWHG